MTPTARLVGLLLHANAVSATCTCFCRAVTEQQDSSLALLQQSRTICESDAVKKVSKEMHNTMVVDDSSRFIMVKAPPQTMATGITKVGIEKFLPTPMAQLSLAADGTLAIPTEKELKDNPPVSLTPDLLSYFEKLREEFPQSTPHTSQVPGGDGKEAPALVSVPASDNPTEETVVLRAGETVANRSELRGLLHLSGPKSKIHKEVQQNGECFFFCLSKWRTRRRRTVSSLRIVPTRS